MSKCAFTIVLSLTFASSFSSALAQSDQVNSLDNDLKHENYLDLWMAYDGLLEDQSKMALVTSELKTSKVELESYSQIRLINEGLRPSGAVSEEELRESISQELRATARVLKLTALRIYYEHSIGIKDLLWRLEAGQQVSMEHIQQLYWSKWEARCTQLGHTVDEHKAEYEYDLWVLKTNRSLLADQVVSRHLMLTTQINAERSLQRYKAAQEIATTCTDGPPFPFISKFAKKN